MAKRISPDVVRQVVRAGRSAGAAESPRPPGGAYLVRRRDVYFFQIRAPKALVACQRIPPLRVRLGEMARRHAQDRASWLARLARAAFAARVRADRGMAGSDEGEIGFPRGDSDAEFLASLLAFLRDAAAQLAATPPPDSPTTLRQMAFVQQLVMLDQEVRRDPLGIR